MDEENVMLTKILTTPYVCLGSDMATLQKRNYKKSEGDFLIDSDSETEFTRLDVMFDHPMQFYLAYKHRHTATVRVLQDGDNITVVVYSWLAGHFGVTFSTTFRLWGYNQITAISACPFKGIIDFQHNYAQ